MLGTSAIVFINAHENKKISVMVLVIDNHTRNAFLQKHLLYQSAGPKTLNKSNTHLTVTNCF